MLGGGHHQGNDRLGLPGLVLAVLGTIAFIWVPVPFCVFIYIVVGIAITSIVAYIKHDGPCDDKSVTNITSVSNKESLCPFW